MLVQVDMNRVGDGIFGIGKIDQEQDRRMVIGHQEHGAIIWQYSDTSLEMSPG